MLRAPEGRSTRPTTDMVRAAVFSLIDGMADLSRVLDLYAGSGALGIEALSRGAGWADFIDQQPKACAIIKANLREIGLAERGHVYCTGVGSALGFLKETYGVVFIDPPYAQADIIGGLLGQLAKHPVLYSGGVVVVCHASRSPLEASYDGLSLVKERRYGDTAVSIYRKARGE